MSKVEKNEPIFKTRWSKGLAALVVTGILSVMAVLDNHYKNLRAELFPQVKAIADTDKDGTLSRDERNAVYEKMGIDLSSPKKYGGRIEVRDLGVLSVRDMRKYIESHK